MPKRFNWQQPDAHAKFSEQFRQELDAKILHPKGTPFVFVFGLTPEEGKAVILGPFNDQAAADAVAAELDNSETFTYLTRDLARATRIIKAELLGRYTTQRTGGQSPDAAISRKGHILPDKDEHQYNTKARGGK